MGELINGLIMLNVGKRGTGLNFETGMCKIRGLGVRSSHMERGIARGKTAQPAEESSLALLLALSLCSWCCEITSLIEMMMLN